MCPWLLVKFQFWAQISWELESQCQRYFHDISDNPTVFLLIRSSQKTMVPTPTRQVAVSAHRSALPVPPHAERNGAQLGTARFIGFHRRFFSRKRLGAFYVGNATPFCFTFPPQDVTFFVSTQDSTNRDNAFTPRKETRSDSSRKFPKQSLQLC